MRSQDANWKVRVRGELPHAKHHARVWRERAFITWFRSCGRLILMTLSHAQHVN